MSGEPHPSVVGPSIKAWRSTPSSITLRTYISVLTLAGLMVLLAGVSSAYAQTGETGSVPVTPDRPSGSALWVGMIDLQWNEVTGADSYDVQYFHVSNWIDLPANDEDNLDIDIAFYGAGAVVKGLSHSGSYTFRVRAVNSHGASGWSEYGWIPQTDGPSAWVDVPEPTNVPATGKPRFIGSLTVGELLTADTSSISDENGLDRVKFYYQWISSDGTTDTYIAGATESSFRLTDADLSGTIKLRVSFTDRHGFPESLINTVSLINTAKPNQIATGAPTISGVAWGGKTLTAGTSDIRDEDGLDNASYSYQWIIVDGTAETDIEGATSTTLALVSEHLNKAFKVRVSFTDDRGYEESLTSAATKAVTCPNRPTPTDVAVTAVPIVVTSTTADYFVLYASFEVDSTTVDYPVLVKKGEDGTTTLAENVAALPEDRYRVEKYAVSAPADVDGDCPDDITELDNLGAMNPVNPAAHVASSAVVIPDFETFDRLSFDYDNGDSVIKFLVTGQESEQLQIYFMDTVKFTEHGQFLSVIGVEMADVARGRLAYDPDLVADDGSPGVYRYRFMQHRFMQQIESFSFTDRVHTLLAANMPLLDDNLALWIKNWKLQEYQDDLPLYRSSRINIVFDDDVYGETGFLALNQAAGYGLLRELDADERPHPRDVVIYQALPNELPRVAGIISTVPQTPLSHVNLRAAQDGVPNAFIADALENDDISDLIDSHVYYQVTDTGYTIRAATQTEVEAHFASSRPARTQTPQSDLTVTAITPLSDIDFDDWDAFGAKAANVAVLGTLEFPEGTVPDGFAIPFYFYDEFMKHNDLDDDIEEMLADSDFQTDYDTMASELKKLRKKIKKAEVPEWIETALTTMHGNYPDGQSLRYRSSTNNEDLPNFNGAGLYDSKTQHPEETEEDGISKSLKQVYASLWNFRAFIERDFHRIDHMAAAMGVLVHPNYSDEQVNGVAVSVDPAYGTDGTYVNSQIGEDLVTNPEAHSVPEEVLLNADGTYTVVALSNHVPNGQLLMTDDQLSQLRRHLETVHERFAELYGVEDGEQFAMEIEFKITSDNALAIKQARPWIFSGPLSGIEPDHTTGGDTSLTGQFEAAPATHSGRPFTVRLRFSEGITAPYSDMRDHGIKVTNGEITYVAREDFRDDRWEITVDPDRRAEDVTLVLPSNIPCAVQGAICAHDGRRLSNRLELTVKTGLLACTSRNGPDVRWPIDPPAFPCQTRGAALWAGVVDLEWDDVPAADGYEVQYYQFWRWIDLPGNSIEIAYYGDGAVVKGLPHSTSYEFRVRAVNSHGASEWSDSWSLPQTGDLGAWAGVPELVNSAATGTPIISGTFQVGETLTTDVSSISDENGLERVKFRYQWISSDGTKDADIRGATAASYTLTRNEAGDTIKVRVSFVDRHGFSESLTSDAVETVVGTPATGAPTISGTVQVGETLTADTSGIADEDGLANAIFSYEWLASDAVIAGANDSSYIISDSDRESALRVRVSFTDDNGFDESLTSKPVAVEDRPYELTASVVDGGVVLTWKPPVVFPYLHDYQILRNRPELGETEPLVYVDTGNDETTYTDTDVEPGVLYVYRVKAASFRVGKASEPVEIRTPAWTNIPATGAPTISGTAQVGETLTADTSGIADEDGLESVTYVYQWLSDDLTQRQDPRKIRGATDSSYELTVSEEGTVIMVQVYFADDAGNAVSLRSEATALVEAAAGEVVWESELTVGREPDVLPEALGYSVSGDLGGTLSPDHFEIDGTVYSVQFLLHFAEGLWLGIDGELPVEFTLSVGESSYEGSESKTPVTGSGSGAYWWPLETPKWSADESVQVSLTIQPQEPMQSRQKAPLTAEIRNIPSEHDGQSTFTFELRFGEETDPDFSYKTLRDHAFTVTGGSVVNARRLNKPSNIRWEITVRPDGNGQVAILLPATTDCAAQGAICTGDGRMLFNRIELTVAGPGG